MKTFSVEDYLKELEVLVNIDSGLGAPEGANQEVLNLGGNKEDNEDNEEQEMNEQIDKFEENLYVFDYILSDIQIA